MHKHWNVFICTNVRISWECTTKFNIPVVDTPRFVVQVSAFLRYYPAHKYIYIYIYCLFTAAVYTRICIHTWLDVKIVRFYKDIHVNACHHAHK